MAFAGDLLCGSDAREIWFADPTHQQGGSGPQIPDRIIGEGGGSPLSSSEFFDLPKKAGLGRVSSQILYFTR